MLSIRIQLPSLQIVETRYFCVKASETGSSIRLTGITAPQSRSSLSRHKRLLSIYFFMVKRTGAKRLYSVKNDCYKGYAPCTVNY